MILTILNLFLSIVLLQEDQINVDDLYESKEYSKITEYYFENLSPSSGKVLSITESQSILKSLFFQNQFQECIEFSKTFIQRLWLDKNYQEVYVANYYLSTSFRRLNQPDSAKTYFEDGLKAAYLTEDPQNISRTLNNISVILEAQRDFTGSISTLHEAINVSESQTDDAKFLSNIAYNYFRLGLLDSAFQLNSRSYQYFNTNNITNEQTWNWRVRFRMGNIEQQLKNKDAIRYFQESLKYTTENSRNHILSLSSIGNSYLRFDLDSANHYLSIALKAAQLKMDIVSMTTINLYRADYLIKTNQPKQILQTLQPGKANTIDRKDMLEYSSHLIRESSYYRLVNDQNKSLEVINAAIDTLNKYSLRFNLAEALTQKFNVYNHFGRYKEALEVKEEEIKVREELFNDRSEAVYQILRTQNEMDKQESTIANQQLEIDNNNLQITIMYISIALVISALVFIFWQYRTRSKYAQKLETMFLDSRHRYMNNLLLLKNWFNEGKTEKNDEIISFAQNRIDAISTVNRHLDRLSYNKNTIESKSFLEDISHNLLANREFTSEIENVPINMSVSGPLGMITNEIITNGLKYGEEPYAIRFQKNGNGYVLEIEDHGPGIADPEKKGTGSKVLRLLSRQLKGELIYQNKADHSDQGRGTLVSLHFKG